MVYWLWATVRLEHLQSWCDSWLPSSVFSAGKGRSSVEAWYSTSIDIEEAISGIVDDDVHVLLLTLSNLLILLIVTFWTVYSPR